jgi:signal transduction histidine kinase
MTKGTGRRAGEWVIVGAMIGSRRWPAILGLVLWAVLCLPTVATIAGALTSRGVRGHELVWLAGCAAYGAALAIGLRRSLWVRWLIAIEGSAAVVMVGTAIGAFNAVLLAIVAWQAGLVLGARRAAMIVIAQATIGAVVAAALAGITWSHILNHVVLQGMGLSMALVVSAEARARRALEHTNAAVAAARHELAAQTRGAERGRIARELHDALGHHLVALSLQLEAASHQTAGAARDAVVQAQTLTRALLGEVREVVSACRDSARIGVPQLAGSALPDPRRAGPAIGGADGAPPRAHASHRWPAILGLALWGINFCQTMYVIGGELQTGAAWLRAGAWLIAFAAYGAALFAGLRGRSGARRLVAIGSAAALAMTALAACYFCTLLLALVAWQAGFAFPVRRALLVVVTQAVASAALLIWLDQAGWPMTASNVVLQAMGLSMALVACGEARARGALERANAALAVTRDELAERTRAAERGHIARELHGSLGHHLVALNLQLAAAGALTAGAAREAVARAQTLTRALLGDIDAVVSARVAPPRIDVPAALRELVDGLDRPRAHLAVHGDLADADAALAHTLVRCVQEMITNVLKHATADNVWIDVARLDDRLEARVSDDGRVAAAGPAVPVRPAHGGHGLSGMTERLAQLGGELSIVRPPDGGWTVVARLPLVSPGVA